MFEEEISKIRYAIQHGEPKKALDMIQKLEKQKLFETEKDILNLEKGIALTRYGHNDSAFEIVEVVLPRFLENEMPKYYLKALILKANLLSGRSQLDEALKVLEKKEPILDSLSTDKLEEFYEERIGLLIAEGTINFHKGEFKRYGKLAQESLEIAEHYNDKHSVGIALLNLSYSNGRMGIREKALDYREESLRVFEEIKNPYWVAYVKHTLGHHYIDLGDYDKAIEYYLEIMPFVVKTENAYQRIVILFHLAYAYNANLEPDIAFDYLLQAYQLLDKTERLDLKEIVLENLIRMYIDKGELEKADRYFDELKPIARQRKEEDYDLFFQRYEIRKIMKKMHENNNALIREEAEGKIRELLEDETIPDDTKKGLLWELCTVLLHEYVSTGNDKLIEEIDSITTIILETPYARFSEIGRIAALSYRIIALWLQAKFRKDEKKIKEIQNLLSKTEEYAGVKGNKLLVKSIQGLQEHYSSLMKELEDFIQNYPTTEYK
ncbi:MAG: tetratricopeptide repeat protein [Asgard group archaeon]|nr:tetratricopeptide repeat protein [Asgard group archaeon]